MTIIDLVVNGSKDRGSEWIVVLAILGGLSSIVTIVIVNGFLAAPQSTTLLDIVPFVLAVAAYVWTIRSASRRVVTAVETSLQQVKLRLVDRLRDSELSSFERVGKSAFLETVQQNLWVISFAASLLTTVIQAASVFLLAIGYFIWLSPTTFLWLAPLLVGGILLFRARQREMVGWLAKRAEIRVSFLARLLDMLLGTKELRLNRARAIDAFEHFDETSADLRDLCAGVTVRWDDSELFLNANLFVMLAFLVFVFAPAQGLELELVSQLVVVLMFAWGSILASIFGYTRYVEANEALDELMHLEATMGGASAPEHEVRSWRGEPGSIELRGICYRYPGRDDEPGFALGPIDLEVQPGEILFIVGGNGAGKSTLLKVLTGLYAPHEGALRFGGQEVGPHNVAAYREQLSVIFTEVHLFKKAYGLLEADPDEVERQLVQMKIEHKTRFSQGRFSTLELSTGQRKRLALVLAMLDDRPVIVFDEWAADQDPGFRRHFYEEILPSLKRRGKAVIAVSHDDRYFDCADRVISLDYGSLRSLEV